MSDYISRQAAIDALAKFVPYAICDESTESYTNGLTDAYNLICQLPSVQPDHVADISKKVEGDCISRQAAKNKKVYSEERHEYVVPVAELDWLPSAQPEPHWIPCDKGEPDEDMECWVTVKTTDALYRGNFTKRYGERRDKGFITCGGFMWWNTALAWMPIYEPEPYDAESEDKE